MGLFNLLVFTWIGLHSLTHRKSGCRKVFGFFRYGARLPVVRFDTNGGYFSVNGPIKRILYAFTEEC